jgi:hypothetical protein
MEASGIPYRLGPASNVRRDHIGINCPMCVNDTNYFFSIDLREGRIRGCWWDRNHWLGPAALISLLARIPKAKAIEILKENEAMGAGDIADMKRTLASINSTPKPKVELKTLPWPNTFREFSVEGRFDQDIFDSYLADRGFPARETGKLYGLRYCATGHWAPRVYFPLMHERNLVGWTGRAVTANAKIRYLTHPTGDGVRHLVWAPPAKPDATTLVICEGPFDALKVDCYAGWSMQAIALMGLNAGPSKISAVVRMASRFKKVVVLLDKGTETQALDLQQALSVMRTEIHFVPDGVKDPGDMTKVQVRQFVVDTASETL